MRTPLIDTVTIDGDFFCSPKINNLIIGKMMKKLLFAVMVAVTPFVSTFAQVSGKVVDGDTKELFQVQLC